MFCCPGTRAQVAFKWKQHDLAKVGAEGRCFLAGQLLVAVLSACGSKDEHSPRREHKSTKGISVPQPGIGVCGVNCTRSRKFVLFCFLFVFQAVVFCVRFLLLFKLQACSSVQARRQPSAVRPKRGGEYRRGLRYCSGGTGCAASTRSRETSIYLVFVCTLRSAYNLFCLVVLVPLSLF